MAVFILCVTLFFPVIMLPLNFYLYVNDKKNGTLYSLLIAIGMAAIAFNISPLPGENSDIVRHIFYLDRVKDISFSEATNNRFFRSLMGYYTILKVCSLANNYQVLPALITFCGYSFCLYVINKMDSSQTKFERFITIFLFISCVNFLGFCSGIRQFIVFSIFVLFFYIECMKNRFRLSSWIVYLLLITVHTSALIMVFIRLLVEILYRRKAMKYIFGAILLWSLVQNSLVGYLAEKFGGNIYVDEFLELSEYYIGNVSNFVFPMYLYRMILLGFCIVMAAFLLKNYDGIELSLSKYLTLALSFCLFTLGGAMSYDLFMRFSMFSAMLSLPLVPILYQKIIVKKKHEMRLLLPIFALLVLIYNLKQYSTVHFNDIYTILFTNIVSLLEAVL